MSQATSESTATMIILLLEPRMALPDKFNGDRKDFRTFINQVGLLFFLNPARYPSGSIKIGEHRQERHNSTPKASSHQPSRHLPAVLAEQARSNQTAIEVDSIRQGPLTQRTFRISPQLLHLRTPLYDSGKRQQPVSTVGKLLAATPRIPEIYSGPPPLVPVYSKSNKPISRPINILEPVHPYSSHFSPRNLPSVNTLPTDLDHASPTVKEPHDTSAQPEKLNFQGPELQVSNQVKSDKGPNNPENEEPYESKPLSCLRPTKYQQTLLRYFLRNS
ncbi:hypothetical protein BASA62_006763 [Batrachochytrium salamandrivorans]|nr:hypothetical protein BASA62_006763 [Batrachochytrium salamandrivorans]